MKTEFLHTYSSNNLVGLSSRSPSIADLSAIDQVRKVAEAHLAKSNNNTDINTNRISAHGIENQSKYEDYYDEDSNCCTRWVASTFTKKNLKKKLPIIGWLPEYNTTKAISDFIAGLSVGLTILPQGLALATVAGLEPQYGLYSGFIGAFVYIFFGGTNEVNIGPTAIMAIITFTYANGKPPEYAVLLCFTTGLVTLLMGLFQLGFIVNFISKPVISGFTSAAALTICSTQLKALLGLSFPAEGFLDVVQGVIEHIEDVKLNDSMVSLACIITLLVLMKIQDICRPCTNGKPILAKIVWLISTSRSVIVILICTVIFSIINKDPADVAVVGDLVPGLPPFKAPPLSFTGNDTESEEIDKRFSLLQVIREDSTALLVMPLLALMEHYSAAKAFAGSKMVDASQELITIGLSNILGSFFSSMPISGTFSRTVLNHGSGVATPMGGLVTGTLVILALEFLTPYFFYIPKAALAAVICCAVIFSVDFSIAYYMWKSKKMDIIPWMATFAVGLFVGLEYGVLVGFVISVVYLMYYAARPRLTVKRGESASGVKFIIIELDRSLTFPSMEYTRYLVMKCGSIWGKNTLPMVIDCQHIQFADYSAAQGMKDLCNLFDDKNQLLILWKMKPSIIRILLGAMQAKNLPFKHCDSDEELENILDDYMAEKEGNQKVKITFTISDENENKNGEDDYSHIGYINHGVSFDHENPPPQELKSD